MLAYSLRVHSPLCSNDTVEFTAAGTCVVREEHAAGMPHILTGQIAELGECLDSVGFIHFSPFYQTGTTAHAWVVLTRFRKPLSFSVNPLGKDIGVTLVAPDSVALAWFLLL